MILNIFIIIFLVSSIFLALGLIKPQLALWWSLKKDRKTVLLFYPTVMIFSFVGMGLVLEEKTKWAYLVLFLLLIFLIKQTTALSNRIEKGNPGKTGEDFGAGEELPHENPEIEKELKTIRGWGRSSSDMSSTNPSKLKEQWGSWFSYIHDDPAQVTRQKRAWGCYIESIDRYNGTARMTASGRIYSTTLKDCTCPDFQKRGKPCKHMYRLAMELDLINLPQFEGREDDYTF